MASLTMTDGDGRVIELETAKNGFEIFITNYPYFVALNDSQMRKLKNWINRQLREKKKEATRSADNSD